MEKCKKMLMVLGVILWVGTLGPEIFIKSGIGCIFDENGKELGTDEASEFMEAFFYNDTHIEVSYRFALLDYLGGIK